MEEKYLTFGVTENKLSGVATAEDFVAVHVFRCAKGFPSCRDSEQN